MPFPPGGGTDLVGRSVGNKLAEALGQRIVIDNRGGAGGTIGAELAVRSDPDGYTMFIGNIGAIAINPSLYAGKLSYDPQRDLAPVTLSSDALNILMVHPALPVKSVKELIALARARPDQLSFSSSGPGATDHLAGELFNRMAGVRTIHVPYRAAGRPPSTWPPATFSSASIRRAPRWECGRPAGCGLSQCFRPSASRFSRSSLPLQRRCRDTASITGTGFFVPAKTPPAIIDRLNAEINKILKMPDIISLHNTGGVVPLGTTPEAFAKFISAETDKWAKVIKEANIKVD